MIAVLAFVGLVGARPASGAPAVSRAQVINTLAGDGTAGYSGDGGAASNASLNGLFGLAEDGAGNLYIADTGNNCIRKVAVGTGVNRETLPSRLRAGRETVTEGPLSHESSCLKFRLR